jgi:lipopolysaccharide cholinephosphotransferase
MNENLSPIQKVLLETFKAFAEICKENNIKYFAASGTLLGAIRHKGFIPWDDDIDVFLLREDYEKLLSLKEHLRDSDYRVADFHDDGYPYPFAKFYDSTKTFWEYKQFPFIIGPFIDLFPLDESDDHNPVHEKLNDDIHAAFWVYRKSISHQTWSEIFKDIVSLNGFEGYIKMVKQIYYVPQRQRYYRRVEKFYKQICSVKGDHYKPYWDVKHIQYPKEWFAKAITVPFEDTEIFVPNGYHEILTYLYKDYMTPPPTHTRSGHHTAYYMNLNRKVGVDEIRQEKKGEGTEKKPMSLSVIWDELIHWKGFN